MASFVGSQQDHESESYMWVKADDGATILYLPLAESSIRWNGNNRLWGRCELDSSSYAVSEDGRIRTGPIQWNFADAEIVRNDQVP